MGGKRKERHRLIQGDEGEGKENRAGDEPKREVDDEEVKVQNGPKHGEREAGDLASSPKPPKT